MPPRHGKSEYSSQILPAWFMGTFPRKSVIITGYNTDFVKGFGGVCRDRLNKFGEADFGVRLTNRQAGKGNWQVIDREGDYGGWCRSVGLGGAITGRGADLLVMDDVIKNAEEAYSERVRETTWQWFETTALTRVEAGGAIIGVMTRWHKDDLFGRLIRHYDEKGIAYHRVRMPAIAKADDPLGRLPGDPLWPQRWPLEELEVKRKSMSTYAWSALFDQDPKDHENTQWPWEYFEDILVDPHEWPSVFEESCVAVDPSLGNDQRKGDYSAVIFTGKSKGKYYVDADIRRRPPSEIVDAALSMAKRHGAKRIGYESNHFQSMLGEVFAERMRATGIRCPVWAIHSSKNKVQRITETLDSFLRDREFRILRSESADLLIQQMRDFPTAEHDDGPDALQMTIELLYKVAIGEVE